MAEFVESIRYEADITDLREKLRRIDSDHDGLSSKTDASTGKMDKAWRKVTSGLGGVVSSLAKVGAAVVATGAIAGIALGKQAIDAASDLSESMSKVSVVFGDASKEVVDWSKTSALAFGQSQQSALEAAGTYGNLFQAFGVGQKPAQEMSQTLVELAADLASFNNTSVEDALAALQSGLSGETEPLKKYGVAINDARLKQKAFEMGLIDSVKDGLDPAAKAQASYALIMEDTTLAQGDFARTSDGLANKQRQLGAVFQDIKAKIGSALLPAFLTVVTVILTKVIPTVTKLWDFFRGGFTGEFTNEGSGVFLFLNQLGMRVGEVVDWVKANWSTISKVITTVLQAAAKAISWVADTVITGLRIAITETVEWVKDNWPEIKAVFWDVIKAIVSIWENQLQPALQAISDATATTFGWLMDHKEVLIGIAAAVGVGLATMFGIWVAGALSAAAATIAAAAPFIAIGLVIAGLTAAVIYAYQNWDWFRNTVDAVATFMRDTVWPILQDVFNWLRDNVPPILQGIADVAMAVFGWMRDNIPPIVQGIVDVFQTGFDVVRTIVETTVGVIQELWSRFGDEILAYITAVWDSIKIVVQAAIDIVRGIIQTVTALISGDWSGAWDGIKGIAQGVWDGITGLIGTALDGIKATLSLAWESVKLTASLAWDGFKSALSGIWDEIETRVKNGASAVIGFVIGIPGKIAEGIGNGFGVLWDNFKDVINNIIDAVNGFKLPGISFGGIDMPGPIPDVPSVSAGPWDIFPHIPRLHGGGQVPGQSGEEVMSVLLAGETVRTARQERMLQQALRARGDGARTGVAITGPVTFESGADVDAVMRIANFHLAGAG